MNATGVCDVRSILTVRRAFHLVPQSSHNEEDAEGAKKAQEEDDEWLGAWSVQRTGSDELDEGGDEGLGRSIDKPKLKMQRSFELLLKTGHVIRFEVGNLIASISCFDPLQC